MYIAIRDSIRVRNEKRIYEKKLVQRFVDNMFYAFTREDVLICVIRGENCSRKITFHEFKEGSKLCNFLIEMIVLLLLVGVLMLIWERILRFMF